MLLGLCEVFILNVEEFDFWSEGIDGYFVVEDDDFVGDRIGTLGDVAKAHAGVYKFIIVGEFR